MSSIKTATRQQGGPSTSLPKVRVQEASPPKLSKPARHQRTHKKQMGDESVEEIEMEEKQGEEKEKQGEEKEKQGSEEYGEILALGSVRGIFLCIDVC